MEGILTILTEKQESMIRPIGITGMPTHWASFACIVGIHLDCHRSRKTRFVGNHALQFSKRPLGVGSVCLPLLLTRLLAFLAFGSLSDVCQMLQSDQMIGVLGHDAFGDAMIGVLLQPSLSSRNDHQTAGRRTSAFLLQTLPQSRIMVGSGNYLLSRVERVVAACVARYSQIADTHIHTSTPLVGLGRWVRCLDLKGNQQRELLLRCVVPEFCR